MDWRGLPISLAGVLASGLPEESRCKRQRSGQTQPLPTLLLAAIADALGLLLWRYSKTGTPKPVSILDTLIGRREEEPQAVVFRSGADFMAAYSRIVR